MIVCPTCKMELANQPGGYECPGCGYQAPRIDGTVYFSADVGNEYENYDAAGLAKLHEFESHHFWFQNRCELILQAFSEYVPKTDAVLEIGAGTGGVARALLENGYDISVGEIHKAGLEYAKGYGIVGRYQVDLFAAPFQEHFNAVGMFDVLEHFADEAVALQKVHGMLKTGGKLIVTVPAHQWLWSRDDEIALHKRRYTLTHLNTVMKENGFTVIKNKHFFLGILPLLYLRTFLHPAKGNFEIKKELQEYDMRWNPWLNAVLNGITRLENRMLKSHCPAFGGSILCIAEKR